MMLFDKLIGPLLDKEGGYVNDPSDSGGETNFGITKATAERAGYHGALVTMTRAQAIEIYKARYWQPVKGDALAAISESLAEEIFDTAVNCGPHRAATFLQRVTNALNDGQRLALDVTVDGRIGPATLRSVKALCAKRNAKTLVKALNCLQGAFYIELAEKREKDERFLYGWLNHRVTL